MDSGYLLLNKMTKVFLGLCLSVMAFASNSNIRINIHYGMTNHLSNGTLGKFENAVFDTYKAYGIPIKKVQSFPSVPEFHVELSKKLTKLVWGCFYNQSSTGGRIHYSDYSGEIRFDYVLSNRSFGFLFRYPLNENKVFSFKESLLMGIMPTTFSFEESIQIGSDRSEDAITVETLGYFFEPGLLIDYKFHKHFSFGVYSGIKSFVISEPYTMGSGYLATSGGKKVKADWIEFKVMFRLGFRD